MYCSKCGHKNADADMFCVGCGSALRHQEQIGASQGANGRAEAPYQQVQYGQSQYGSSNQVQYGASPNVAQPNQQRGVFGQAWADVKASESWFGRIALLGLINIVPILNFVVQGYAFNWGAKAARKDNSPMPRDIFGDHAFKKGFFAWLVILIDGLIYGLAEFVLILLGTLITPIIGTIIMFIMSVCLIFAVPFMYLSAMRTVMANRLGAGLQFSEVWKAYKIALGKVMAAYWLPTIIIGIIAGVISAIVAVAIGGPSLMYVMSVLASGVSYVSSTMAARVIASYTLVVLICYLITMFTSSFTVVLMGRAMGYAVARMVPQWADELAEPSPYQQMPYGQPYTAQPQYANPAPQQNPYAAPVPAGFGAPQGQVVPQPQPQSEQKLSVLSPETVMMAAPAQGAMVAGNDNRTSVLVQPEDTPKLQVTLIRRNTGAVYKIVKMPSTLGKGSAADIRIDGNDSISRVHVRIGYTGSVYVVEEMNATNKTYVNGAVLGTGEVVVLRNGDVLKISDEVFDVQI